MTVNIMFLLGRPTNVEDLLKCCCLILTPDLKSSKRPSSALSCADVNECWNCFLSIMNDGIHFFTPLKLVRISNKNAKGYPLHIRKLIRKKCAAWRLYKRYKSDSLRQKYLSIKKQCATSIAAFIKQKEDSIIRKDNLGLFYSM